MTHPMLTWFYAQLDEHERIAQAAGWKSPHWDEDDIESLESEAAQHIALHDPAAVLADIASKRAIAALHSPRIPPWGDELKPDIWQVCGSCGTSDGWNDVNYPCPTMRALASAFASRPGYRKEWKPS